MILETISKQKLSQNMCVLSNIPLFRNIEVKNRFLKKPPHEKRKPSKNGHYNYFGILLLKWFFAIATPVRIQKIWPYVLKYISLAKNLFQQKIVLSLQTHFLPYSYRIHCIWHYLLKILFCNIDYKFQTLFYAITEQLFKDIIQLLLCMNFLQ